MKCLFELPLDPIFHFPLVASGASPLYTLGVTYIDDNVSKKMSSVYLGESFHPRDVKRFFLVFVNCHHATVIDATH